MNALQFIGLTLVFVVILLYVIEKFDLLGWNKEEDNSSTLDVQSSENDTDSSIPVTEEKETHGKPKNKS